MIETLTGAAGKISLPLLAPKSSDAWNGFVAADPLPHLAEAVPVTPQGAYNEAEPETPLTVPVVDLGAETKSVELLAPAGGPDAAFAALHFGADAVYLGLKKFSARAEAENFTLDELDEITAYAHSLEPARRVFVTVNTLIRQDELAELFDDLAALDRIGVDAVILQDLGVYRAIRQFFPRLELHGSTQMAVHNRAGAEAVKQLGFRRVVLARELTFEEVRDVTGGSGIETEVFIHGALCYAYSGLCLFSAQTLGRSGNRGKCAYSCRDSYEVADAPLTLRDGSAVKRDPGTGFPFSMKDLALPDHLPALRAAGVSCFKIEGRKKSQLYVATTTDYYRRLIDGRLDSGDRPNIEADLQTVFSRPWTRLFVQSHKDKEVADRDTVGHRGALIGRVDTVLAPHTLRAKLRFRTRRRIERHDGLQIDLPILGKPFGFAIDHLWVVGDKSGREAISAAAGAVVEVSLPLEHPNFPSGAPVYCSSSQEVKQRYRHDRPKPAQFRTRRLLQVDAVLSAQKLIVSCTVVPGGWHDRPETAPPTTQAFSRSIPGPFPPANDLPAMEVAFRAAFERLGNTGFELKSLTLKNEVGGFVPVSRLNQLRRDLIVELEKKIELEFAANLENIRAHACPAAASRRGQRHESGLRAARKQGPQPKKFAWSLKIDRLTFVDSFEDQDWNEVDELVVDIARDHPAVLRDKLETIQAHIGRDRIRLALPALTRAWEEKGLLHKVDVLREAGWHKWEAANLSAWTYLGIPLDTASPRPPLDLAADWSVYVLNRMAALQLIDMGVSRFCLSPEDGIENWRSLLREFGDRAVLIVHQDTPLFLAESCAYANLIGGCPGKANCNFETMDMVSSHGEKVTAIDYHCRTIVLNQGPYCLSTRLDELADAGAVALRADFIYRNYQPDSVRERWRLVRSGRAVPGGHSANFKRGIL